MKRLVSNLSILLLLALLVLPGTAQAGIIFPSTEEISSAAAGVALDFVTAIVQAFIWVTNAVAGVVIELIPGLPLVGGIVRNLWIVVLGVTNLGFLLALLAIAMITVLQLEIGGGVRRLLPRLFIGVLLVNFSLVIALTILDFVTIVVAALSLANGGGLSTVRGNILYDGLRLVTDQSGLRGDVFNGVISHPGWGDVGQKIVEGFFTFLVMLGLLVLAFLLFLRTIALAALIVVSPVPYLAVALPGAQAWARKWWAYFLTMAFYPIAVLFVILMTFDVVNALYDTLRPSWNLFFLHMMISAVIASGLYFAGYLGFIASQAGAQFVMTAAKRTAKGVYVGTGTRAGVRYGRAYAGGVGSQARRNLLSRIGFSTADPGLRGRRRGDRLVQSRTDRAAVKAAVEAASSSAGVQGNIKKPALSGSKITSGAVTRGLLKAPGGFQNIRELYQHGSVAQLKRLSKSKDHLSQLDSKQQIKIQQDIENNKNFQGLNDNNRASLLADIQDTIDKASKDDEGKTA